MTEQLYKDVYDEQLAEGAIINDRHTGHKEDYMILHILLKKYKPKTFFEVGTNSGYGTLIIKNAIPDATVFSLDLPDEMKHISKQHPLNEDKPGVGYECTSPYVQLRGNSMDFDYTKYPCEGYFVDTDHTYENVFAETKAILKVYPKIIIHHDADEFEVFNAIIDAMEGQPYEIYRVTDTRIMYAIRK